MKEYDLAKICRANTNLNVLGHHCLWVQQYILGCQALTYVRKYRSCLMPGGVVKKYVRGVYGHFLLFGRFIRRKPDGQRRSKGRVLQTHCLTSPANSHVMETGTLPVQPSLNPKKDFFASVWFFGKVHCKQKCFIITFIPCQLTTHCTQCTVCLSWNLILRFLFSVHWLWTGGVLRHVNCTLYSAVISSI